MLASLACDLQTKQWAWETLRNPRRSIVVIDPLVELDLVLNTGSAFGLLQDAPWARTVLIVATLGALAYMAWLAWNMPTQQRHGFVGIALIAGGALGNLHDRLLRVGFDGRHGVVDFLKLNYPWGGSWPTFNVADVALLAGVVLLLLYLKHHGHTLDEGSWMPSSQHRVDGSPDANPTS